MASTEPKETKKTAKKYKGSELIRAASGTDRDVLSILLQPDEMYTRAEADSKKAAYLKKEVKADGGRNVDNTK